MLPALLSIALGLALLYYGAEFLVRGGTSIGLRLGLSPLVIGLTIVAFGTSAPELAVSIQAALAGRTDVSVGNVVGSNIVNIGLILGLSVVVRAVQVNVKLIRTDIPLMIGVCALFALLIFDGAISRLDGALLFAGVIAFTGYNVWAARRARPRAQEIFAQAVAAPTDRFVLALGLVLLGIVLLVGGGRFLVEGAITIARSMGISQAVIGLTVVAIGTSLPELATSLLAAAKRMGDLSVGNVIGSNIFNILCILGVSGLVVPLPLGNVTWLDIGVMLLLSVAVLPLARTGFTLRRWEGALLVAGYVAYVGWLLVGAAPG